MLLLAVCRLFSQRRAYKSFLPSGLSPRLPSVQKTRTIVGTYGIELGHAETPWNRFIRCHRRKRTLSARHARYSAWIEHSKHRPQCPGGLRLLTFSALRLKVLIRCMVENRRNISQTYIVLNIFFVFLFGVIFASCRYCRYFVVLCPSYCVLSRFFKWFRQTPCIVIRSQSPSLLNFYDIILTNY